MKKLLIVFTLLLMNNPSYSYDLSELGDFSSRSIIENRIYKKETLTQEQKNILTYKKLSPNIRCLFEQVKNNNYENTQLLLQAGVNPNQNYMGEYVIYIAAKKDNLDILKLLYDNNAKLDRGFYSELYEALRNKNKDMAQYLLDKGARVNYTDAITNNTILYMALKNKMYNIASQIIEKGAKADVKSVKYIRKNKLNYLIPVK